MDFSDACDSPHVGKYVIRIITLYLLDQLTEASSIFQGICINFSYPGVTEKGKAAHYTK